MKATELRIGNYLTFETDLCFVSTIEFGVKEYRDSMFCCTTVKGEHFIGNSTQRNFKPILLTEEWLMKLGFKELGDNSFEPWESSIYSLEYIRNHWLLLYKSNEVISTPFKYVHQLQNLFFALTGTELEMKVERSTWC